MSWTLGIIMACSCSIGIFKEEVCHKLSYSRCSVLHTMSEFTEEQKTLFTIRTGCNDIKNVCTFHKATFLDRYFHIYGKSCSDPCGVHSKPIKKSLRQISMEFSLLNPKLQLIPGKALCTKCLDTIRNCKQDTDNGNKNECLDIYEPNTVLLEKVNKACSVLDISPVKAQKRSVEDRQSILKKKVSKIAKSATQKLNKSFDLNISSDFDDNFSMNMQVNLAHEYEQLIYKLKEKMKVAISTQEKVNILSLVPSSWSISKVQSEFNVSQYLIRQSRSLVQKNGILPQIGNNKARNKLDEATMKTVQDFYENDEYSRMMAGKKDCLSVRGSGGEKVNIQKRLILCNLKELYAAFKEKYPLMKIGFSRFAELRPKFCILTGASGTHSVCVCIKHQNVKLMLAAMKLGMDYKYFLSCMVCNIDNELCMLSKCSECPGNNKLHTILEEGWEDFEKDETEIKFKQWVSTDRCELSTCVLPFKEYLEKLVEMFEKLKAHHFIAKKQTEFLNTKKGCLQQCECILMVDFSENFSFVIQDEVQAYHWSSNQATIHPFMLYFKKNDKLEFRCFCVISDSLEHNTTAFYAFQKLVIESLRSFLPQLKKIIYFSDGSAAQYKNCKNSINLCYHKQDFEMEAEWHFFATCHGKGPCDGIGGTVKRIVRKASLQRTVDNHIITPLDMFKYCTENIKNIDFLFCSRQNIEEIEQQLQTRYQLAIRTPQTRTLHSFIPLSLSVLHVRITSVSEEFKVVTVSKENPAQLQTELQPKVNDYVCCLYDNDWWLGEVVEVKIYDNNEEFRIHYFHP